MIKSLRARLTRLFLVVMMLASAFSFLAMALVSNRRFISEIRAGQTAIAVAIIELDQKTDFSLDKILKIASNPLYHVYLVEDTDSIGLSAEERSRLESDQILYKRGRFFPIGRTMVLIEGRTIMIENQPRNNIVLNTVLRVTFSLLFAVVIGTSIVIATAKRAFKPIYKINDATKEVARGNFDIQIKDCGGGEIGELASNFNKMAHELRNMEVFRRDFISNVSHEFKTPIASIQGFAKLIKSDDITQEEKKEYAEIIAQEADRMSKLISNVLKLSKLENQEIVINQATFSLDEQIRRTILLLESEWSRKNITFHLELEKLGYCGSEELLQQVWLNLLDNSIKFSDQNGEITVKLYDSGTKAVVKVMDNGIGMDEEIQKRVFEKFFQGDKARSSDGSGLGLPLVKRIIDICGGTIKLRSKPSQGTSITVELPKNQHSGDDAK